MPETYLLRRQAEALRLHPLRVALAPKDGVVRTDLIRTLVREPPELRLRPLAIEFALA